MEDALFLPIDMDTVWRFGDATISIVDTDVYCNGVPMNLSLSETRLLTFFLKHGSSVLTADMLAEALRESEDEPVSRNRNLISVYVCKLRKKLKRYTNLAIIETVPRVGYMCTHARVEPAEPTFVITDGRTRLSIHEDGRVWVSGVWVNGLSYAERKFLLLLAKQQGEVVTHAAAIQALTRFGRATRKLSCVYAFRIRCALGPAATFVKTVRRSGFALNTNPSGE